MGFGFGSNLNSGSGLKDVACLSCPVARPCNQQRRHHRLQLWLASSRDCRLSRKLLSWYTAAGSDCRVIAERGAQTRRRHGDDCYFPRCSMSRQMHDWYRLLIVHVDHGGDGGDTAVPHRPTTYPPIRCRCLFRCLTK